MVLLPDAATTAYFLTSIFLIQDVSSAASATKAAVLPSGAVDSPAPASGKALSGRELPQSLMRRQTAPGRSGSLGRHVLLSAEDRWTHSLGGDQPEGDEPTIAPTDGESIDENNIDPEAKTHPEVFEFRDEACTNMSGGFRMPDQAAFESGACIKCTDLSQEEKEIENAMGLPVSVMLTCSEEDDATLFRIFGEDCDAGDETPHDFEIKKEQAQQLTDGECIQAERKDTKMKYWLKMNNSDKLASTASCITSHGPVSAKTKKIILILAIVWGSVSLVIVLIILIFLLKKKSKKGEKLEGAEETAEEEPAEAAEAAEEAEEKEEGEADDAAETAEPEEAEAKKEEKRKKYKKKEEKEDGGVLGMMGF
mmetsp:Transcript_137900/g.253634  ORF Transcript_137900/g.253634 Transcript_137900/m.253634 type:complete len:366 (+) Transcript_137900:20-1117(+)